VKVRYGKKITLRKEGGISVMGNRVNDQIKGGETPIERMQGIHKQHRIKQEVAGETNRYLESKEGAERRGRSDYVDSFREKNLAFGGVNQKKRRGRGS